MTEKGTQGRREHARRQSVHSVFIPETWLCAMNGHTNLYYGTFAVWVDNAEDVG
jgi:hypothetical protein